MKMNERTREDRIVRATEICRRLSISPTTLWRWRRAGIFPNPKTIQGTSLQGWLESEFDVWVTEHLTVVMEGRNDDR